MSREATQVRPPLGAALAFTILALVLSLGAYVIAGLGKRGHVPVTPGLAQPGQCLGVGDYQFEMGRGNRREFVHGAGLRARCS